MSQQPDAIALPLPDAGATRALAASPTYWLAMFAASALGTNLGDLWVDGLSLTRPASFASLVAICAVAIWGDRRAGTRTEAFFWVAIVALRAAATNLADGLTHDLRLGYVGVTVALGALSIGAGCLTRPSRPGAGSPVIDAWYWLAMLIAGVFGTVGGDLASHSLGLLPAASLLCTVLLVCLVARSILFPGAMLAYWCAVLAERCAGTPVGDSIASHHAIGLGLPLATCVTLTGFLLALLLRRSL